MNKVILMGRLARDAEIRYSQGQDQMAIGRFTLAVDRRVSRNDNGNQPTADFISCVAFGKTAEFLERYGRKGVKFVVEGRIQTGSYTNKDNQKVYTTDVVVESMEFAESKNAAGSTGSAAPAQQNNSGYSAPAPATDKDGFMNLPDGIDEELPFN